MAKRSKFYQAQILYLFAEIQNHLHNGTIRHELTQMMRHTTDQEILNICNRAAECLDIEIETTFFKLNEDQLTRSLEILVRHLKWAKERFDKVIQLAPECDPKWIDSPLKATELQLLYLSNYFTLLDKVPDIRDIKGEVIRVGDLIAIPCEDNAGRDYEHYGVLISTPKGFRVAHFFTGATVKPRNSLVEKGFGYIQEVIYHPDWAVKKRLSLTIPYYQVEQRIRESKKVDNRIWNKLTYNCEHWAREMVDGQPSCTQLEKWREEIRSQKKSENSVK